MTTKVVHWKLSLRILLLLGSALLALLFLQQAMAARTPSAVTIEGRLHIVQSGENLTSIAESRDFDEMALRHLNGMEADQTVWAGQPLLMPPAHTPGPALSGANSLHRVTKGETLHSIAVQYGLHPVELAHMNQMAPNDILYVGREIRVPSIDNWARLLDRGYMQQFQQYVVRDHETPISIAQQFGTTEDLLRIFNALSPTDVPAAGTVLALPPPEWPSIMHLDGMTSTSLGQLIRLKEKWIEIDLGMQKATAYRGMTPIRKMAISSGMEATPTVTGLFRIWAKTVQQDMSLSDQSPNNDLDYVSDVPWVQYFYRDFALHGAYWSSLPGTPSSMGNILLSEADAEWLYNWTTPNSHMQGFEAAAGWVLSATPDAGTLIFIHN